jgi:hypothetical protein
LILRPTLVKIHPPAVKQQILICCCCLISWAAGLTSGFAGDDNPVHWLSIESKYTMIRYQTPEDLVRFDRQLKYEPASRGLKNLFSHQRSGSITEKVAGKVDALFERVQEILEMRRNMERPTIFIHPDRDQLHEAYTRLFNRPWKIRAWYQYSTNGVYVNVNDLHEGMLAHELAHAIIDHYLLIRPPAATAEVLARYVDSHLKD